MKKALLRKYSKPTLDLDFTARKFSHEVLFSRNSAATMIGQNGFRWAPCNLLDKSELTVGYANGLINGLDWYMTDSGLDESGYRWFEYTVSGTLTATNSEPSWLMGSTSSIGITPKGEYTASVNVEVTQTNATTATLTMRLTEFDSTTTFVAGNYSGTLSLSSTGKQQFFVTSKTQSNSVKAACQIRLINGVIGNYYSFKVRVSRASLYPGPFVNEYYPTYGSQYFGPRDEYRYAYTPMNLVPNSSMAGATPSTVPTNWTISAPIVLPIQIVNSGVEDGFEFIDLRWYGTNTVGSTQYPNIQIVFGSNCPYAKVGMQFSGSIEVKYISGTQVPLQLSVQGLSSSNTYIEGGGGEYPVLPDSNYTVITKYSTFSNVNTAKCNMLLQRVVLPNESYDFTIRIRKPQLNRGPNLCEYIKTSNGSIILSDIYKPIGRLLETSKTNLLVVSTDADNFTGITSMEGASSSGITVNSFKLINFVGNATTNPKFVYGTSFNPSVSTMYTCSVVVAKNNRDIIQITPSSNWSTIDTYANFDTVSGKWLTVGAGVIQKQFLQISENCFRISITFNSKPDAIAGAGIIVAPLDSDVAVRLPGSTAGSSLYFGYHQIELGEGMTSIIPTYGTQATRAFELCWVNNTNWLNPNLGTLYSEVLIDNVPTVTDIRYYTCLNDGSAANRVLFRMVVSSSFDSAVCSNSVFQGIQFGGIDTAIIANKINKHAVSFGTSACQSLNGKVTGISYNITPPVLNRLDIGNQPTGGYQANGHILKVKYFKTIYNQNSLIALTK